MYISIPSTISNVTWICAYRQIGIYPPNKADSGKFLIFLSIRSLDAVWAKVAQATESGMLGSESKSSTLKRNPHVSSGGVICVGSYSFADGKDRSRIRKALYEIGIYRPLPYKFDSDTIIGKYKFNSKGRFTKSF